jgi:transcriptional regulator with XRE-family HTH domain
VTNLSPEICFRLKAARKAAKVGQSELAREVGCKQSAISMFESGKPTKLSEETIKRIAKKFGVLLSAEKEDQPAIPAVTGESAAKGFCPNSKCPSNSAYEVEGRRYFIPDREKADPVGGKFCALCGEVLEKCCPNCGAPVHAGAVCSICGDPYISC